MSAGYELKLCHPKCPTCGARLTVIDEPVDELALRNDAGPIVCACGWHGTDWIAEPAKASP